MPAFSMTPTFGKALELSGRASSPRIHAGLLGTYSNTIRTPTFELRLYRIVAILIYYGIRMGCMNSPRIASLPFPRIYAVCST